MNPSAASYEFECHEMDPISVKTKPQDSGSSIFCFVGKTGEERSVIWVF